MKRQTKTPVRPIVLNIAGNDSAGMAGLAMDIRTQSIFGIHSASTITANTAQNNIQFSALNPVDFDVFRSQLDAAFTLPIDVIKTGLICSREQIYTLKDRLENRQLPLICDPVLASSSGHKWYDESFLASLREDLIPLAHVITPNLEEASIITGTKIRTTDDIETAAKMILSMGARSVIIKGGHSQKPWAQDYFLSSNKSFWLSSKRIDSLNTRGTGCAFASALASALALGYPINDAVVIAKMAINQGIRLGYSSETDKGPVSVQAFPDRQIDLPCLTREASFNFDEFEFPPCNEPRLGIYPVVDRAEWIEKLVPAGISTLQLRVKDLKDDELENEIKHAIQLAKKYQCRLFINDFWQLAIKHKAYGVHLGQEDIEQADIRAIHSARLRLGISTHCHYEVAQAHSFRPSYLACGPVYHTNTKSMPWIPQGLEGLTYWRKVLHYPLVAIGGINSERLEGVAATGVDSIAMITAITQADKPEEEAQSFIKTFEQYNS